MCACLFEIIVLPSFSGLVFVAARIIVAGIWDNQGVDNVVYKGKECNVRLERWGLTDRTAMREGPRPLPRCRWGGGRRSRGLDIRDLAGSGLQRAVASDRHYRLAEYPILKAPVDAVVAIHVAAGEGRRAAHDIAANRTRKCLS